MSFEDQKRIPTHHRKEVIGRITSVVEINTFAVKPLALSIIESQNYFAEGSGPQLLAKFLGGTMMALSIATDLTCLAFATGTNKDPLTKKDPLA